MVNGKLRRPRRKGPQRKEKQKRKQMKMFKRTYAKKEILLKLALDIYECTSEVIECKS